VTDTAQPDVEAAQQEAAEEDPAPDQEAAVEAGEAPEQLATPQATDSPEASADLEASDLGADAHDKSAADVFAVPENAEPVAGALETMLDLPLDVSVELGQATMQLGEALSLRPGSIIELDRLPGEPLDMHVNDRLVARGEVVVINDALGLRVTEVIGRGRDEA